MKIEIQQIKNEKFRENLTLQQHVTAEGRFYCFLIYNA